MEIGGAGTGGDSYELPPLAAAAVRFARALEGNRERLAAEAGLTQTELRVLFQVALHSPTTPKEIADRIGVSTAAMTQLTRSLDQRGLVQRQTHPTDGRSILLELSERGHEHLRCMHRQFNGLLSRASAELGEDERAELVEVLDSMADRIRADLDTP
ncbi:MarR family transcriptional regulator [Microbacterium chocolatum]|uniref:MarR family winged helix-turn-helix transcriptional regulator n=1 Tax=Microbacterium aurantiacum TaxID=162393 RepID=UPI00339074CF